MLLKGKSIGNNNVLPMALAFYRRRARGEMMWEAAAGGEGETERGRGRDRETQRLRERERLGGEVTDDRNPVQQKHAFRSSVVDDRVFFVGLSN